MLDDETPISEQSKTSSPAPTSSSSAGPPRRKKAKVDSEATVDKMLIKSLQKFKKKLPSVDHKETI